MSEANISCQPLLDRLTHIMIRTKFIQKFKKLDTLEKKISFCLSDDEIKYDDSIFINIRKEVYNLIEVFYSLSTKHGKSYDIADQLKTKGSKAFMKKKDIDAFKYYTDGLRHAPEGSPILAILYANRSATHIQRNNFEECLDDIQRAEEAGYPSEAKFKLYKRKIEALSKLGRKKEAEEALQHAALNIPLTIKESASKLLEELQKQISALSTDTKQSEKDIASLPKLFAEEEQKEMSGALKIRVNAADGRHIEADSDIPKGSALFKEKPFASILLPEYFLTHCQHCYSLLKNPIPCNGCCDILWCGENCRRNGQIYHNHECGNLHILTSVGIAHLSLRIVLVAGWQVCQEVIKRKTENETEEKLAAQFHSKDKISRYKSVYDLITHFDKASPDDQFQYCLAGIILAKVVTEKTRFFMSESDNKNCFKSSNTDMTFVTICSVLAHHISQLISNAHAITQIEGNRLGDEISTLTQTSQTRIATAIYPLASLMNHSCKPSIINSFHSDVLIIHCIEDIHSGDQLYNCYGPHASRQERYERQAALERQYFFHCECVACTDDRTLINEASWFGLKCPSCLGIAEMIKDKNETMDNCQFKCISCFKSGIMPQGVVQKCSETNSLYEEGQEYFKTTKYNEAEKCLVQALRIGEEVYVGNNEFLSTIRDDLAKNYVYQGKIIEALQQLSMCIKTIETRYGAESIEVAHELVTYLYIVRLNPSSDSRLVRKMKKRIIKIFTIHYGKNWNNYLKLYDI